MDDIFRFRMMEPEFQLVDEEELNDDREYLIKLYPARARIIMVLVEDECDKLEYEGSPMFAAYPDKESMLMVSRKIYDRMGCMDNAEDMKHLIDVMVCDEFFVRRSRYKRRRKFF